jgi:hypothetical protein
MAHTSKVYRLIEALHQGPRPSEHTVLANGNNTITKPTGADGAIVFMDPANTAVVLLKSVNADQGIIQDKTGAFAITCGGASFVINVDANTVAAVRWFRFQ